MIPLETTNYVPIILAMTIMEKNAAAYGIDNISPDPALEYDTVDMTAPTALTLLADITETPVTELAALNRRSCVTWRRPVIGACAEGNGAGGAGGA